MPSSEVENVADRIKGITVEINGDTTGLSKSLAGVNKEISNTQKQLKDVDRLLKLDPKNTELLRQKQKLLGDAIGQTEQKLEKLKDAEAQLKSKGVDENSEQFMALRREIVATEQSLDAYKKQSKDTTDALEKDTKAKKQNAQATEDNAEKHGKLKEVLADVGKGFAAAAAAATAAAAAIGKALVSASKDAAAYADDVLTTATVTGMSAERIQELQYAAELVDVSFETMSGSMRKNLMSMNSAASGTGAAAEAYAKLGVAITDSEGNLRDSEKVYWDVLNALGQIENDTERDATAMELFGKSAQDLNPLIAAGADRLDELAQKAHDAGAVMSDDMLDSFGELDDNLQMLKQGAGAAKNALGTILLPVLKDMSGTGTALLGKFSKSVLDAEGDYTKLGDIIGELIPDIITALTDSLPDIIDGAMSILFSLMDAITENLPDLLDRLVPMVVNLLNGLIERLPDILGTLISLVGSLIQSLAGALPQLLPVLLDAVIKLLDVFSNPDVIAQLIDSVVTIVLTLIDFLTDPANIVRLVEALVKFVGALVTGLIKALPNVLQKLWDSITGFFDKIFHPDTSKWSDGVKSFVNKLIDGLNKVIGLPFKGINEVLEKIRDISILGAKPFDWIKTIKVPQIPLLAKGGILSQGAAIVGEAGPEVLSMQNGRAHVQPLTASVDTDGLVSALGKAHVGQQPIQLTINYTGDLAQLARVLQPEIALEGMRRGGGLA